MIKINVRERIIELSIKEKYTPDEAREYEALCISWCAELCAASAVASWSFKGEAQHVPKEPAPEAAPEAAHNPELHETHNPELHESPPMVIIRKGKKNLGGLSVRWQNLIAKKDHFLNSN